MAQQASDVPAFLLKLWRMVEDSPCDHLISWGPAGTSFIVHDQGEFSKQILPRFFKHSNFASFVRQLNMYGFRKLTGPEQGSLHSAARENFEFSHSNFQRNKFDLLDQVKRKLSHGRLVANEPRVKSEDVERVLGDIQAMKDHQMTIDENLGVLVRNNQAIWDEVVRLRNRSQQQEIVINKLLHFLLRVLYTKTEFVIPARRKRFALTELDEEPSPKFVAMQGERSAVEGDGQASVDSVSLLPSQGPIASDLLLNHLLMLSPAGGNPVASTPDVIGVPAVIGSQAQAQQSVQSMTASGVAPIAEPAAVAAEAAGMSVQSPKSNTAASPHSSVLNSLVMTPSPYSPEFIDGSLLPVLPECGMSDTLSLSEHLDSLDTGLHSVKSVFNNAIDPTLLEELFSQQQCLEIDPNSRMMLESITSGCSPTEEQVSDLKERMGPQGCLLPLMGDQTSLVVGTDSIDTKTATDAQHVAAAAAPGPLGQSDMILLSKTPYLDDQNQKNSEG